jgi:hypothetical protein
MSANNINNKFNETFEDMNNKFQTLIEKYKDVKKNNMSLKNDYHLVQTKLNNLKELTIEMENSIEKRELSLKRSIEEKERSIKERNHTQSSLKKIEPSNELLKAVIDAHSSLDLDTEAGVSYEQTTKKRTEQSEEIKKNIILDKVKQLSEEFENLGL